MKEPYNLPPNFRVFNKYDTIPNGWRMAQQQDVKDNEEELLPGMPRGVEVGFRGGFVEGPPME